MGCFSREGKRGEGEAFFLALPRMKGKKSFEQVLEWITWPRKSNLCDAILPVKAVKSMLHCTFHEHCQGAPPRSAAEYPSAAFCLRIPYFKTGGVGGGVDIPSPSSTSVRGYGEQRGRQRRQVTNLLTQEEEEEGEDGGRRGTDLRCFASPSATTTKEGKQGMEEQNSSRE